MEQLKTLTTKARELKRELIGIEDQIEDLVTNDTSQDQVLMELLTGKIDSLFEPWNFEDRNQVIDALKRNNIDYKLKPIRSSDGTAYDISVDW